MDNRQELNRNLAQMLKGGVIMDVTTPEQAKIAEAAGAFAEMEAYWRALGAEVFEIRQRADLERGLDLLAEKIDNPGSRDETRPERWFGVLPVAVRRNAYGRQLGSFTTRGDFDGKHDFPMTFIRAPAITEVLSPEVETLSAFDGRPTSVRWRNITAFTWHPELNT